MSHVVEDGKEYGAKDASWPMLFLDCVYDIVDENFLGVFFESVDWDINMPDVLKTDRDEEAFMSEALPSG